MTAPEIGLPYASAEFDERGRYHVVCPLCGFACYPEGGSGHATIEDDVTKGASAVYALHYRAEHVCEAAGLGGSARGKPFRGVDGAGQPGTVCRAHAMEYGIHRSRAGHRRRGRRVGPAGGPLGRRHWPRPCHRRRLLGAP